MIHRKDDFKGRAEGPEGGAIGSEGGVKSSRGLAAGLTTSWILNFLGISDSFPFSFFHFEWCV